MLFTSLVFVYKVIQIPLCKIVDYVMFIPKQSRTC